MSKQSESEIQETGQTQADTLLNINFDLSLPYERPSFIEVPASSDIGFEYIQLDLERLNNLKKNNFWNYLINNIQPHLRFGETLTIDKLISYYPKYEEPLFTMKNSLNFFVEKIYHWVIKLTEDEEDNVANIEKKIKSLAGICLDKDKVLTDETFLILIKQQRNNPNKDDVERIWQLLACLSNSLLPSENFIYPLYNYYVAIIDNHPEERIKEWAKYCIKRLYELDRAKFKRNFNPSSREIAYSKARKKIPLNINLQNGRNFELFVESYYSVSDILKIILKKLGINKSYWVYFGLRENVEKHRQLEERPLNDNILIGDVISNFELVMKLGGSSIRSCRVYLVLKVLPTEKQAIESLKNFLLYGFVYNMFYDKECLDRIDIIKKWGTLFQLEYGDFSEKPGFIKTKLRSYYHSFFLKYYSDESFITSVEDNYKTRTGMDRDTCIKDILGLGEDNQHDLYNYFRVKFRNSNNQNFREMHENMIIAISNNYFSILEEVSKEKVMDIELEEVMSWGINEGLFVLCYGDKFETIKLYFECFNPYEIADLLFAYANLKNGREPGSLVQKHEQLDKFMTNEKVRKVNLFSFK